MTTLEQHVLDEARRAELQESEREFFAALSLPQAPQPTEEPSALTLADLQRNAEAGRLKTMSTAGGVQRELIRMAKQMATPSPQPAPEDTGMQFSLAQHHASIHALYGAQSFELMLECLRANGRHAEAAAAMNEVNTIMAMQSLVDQNIIAPAPLPQHVIDKIELECLLVEGELLAERMGLKS